MMQSFKKLIIGLAALLLLTVGHSANAVTLDTLLSGGTITSGNLTFGNFSYTDSANLSVPASTINVIPIQQPFSKTYGLEFSGSWVTSTTPVTADYTISYTVTAPTATIDDYELNMTGAIIGTPPTGQITIAENAIDQNNNGLASIGTALAYNGSYTPTLSILSAKGYFPLQSKLLINKNINISNGAGTITHLSVVDQNFSQVPEPSALMMLFGSGICGSLFFLRKRSVA